MYRLFLLAAMPLMLAGCLRPLTDRLDDANARLARVNEQT